MNAKHRSRAMQTRREILLTCARSGGLLALGGAAAMLGWRSLRGACHRSQPCGGCPLFSGCELPKTLENRPPASPNTVRLGPNDSKTGFQPVMEDSASCLSANGATGWKPVFQDRQDAYPPVNLTALPASPPAAKPSI